MKKDIAFLSNPKVAPRQDIGFASGAGIKEPQVFKFILYHITSCGVTAANAPME
jgi:hypothetical protein